jgi:glyoxylase-like metal-dependent hydrolase (beta-lactamase superfamily II)
MRRLTHPALAFAITALLGGCAHSPLHTATHALGAENTHSIEFSGTGKWYQFGQAPNPSLAWPAFAVSRYTADINYDTPGARVRITRKQIVEPDRQRPTPVEQKPDQYVSGATAWNLAPPANSAPGAAPVPTPQPLAVEERVAEIWATPQGFLKAAHANRATRQDSPDGKEISFTLGGKYRYVGTLNGKNQVEKVQTWIDNPVLGDTLVETRFSDYKDFGGVRFPSHIVRTQGGYPVLDLNVTEVKLNPAVDIAVPKEIAAAAPVLTVTSTELAKGVYYLTGGTHHSVAIEQKDHVVLVEAPLNEARSLAVIAKVKEIIPGKPIKYVVNTHAHFDHSGGLRTYAAEGATIVTETANAEYYKKIWANPHDLNPDLLSKSTQPVGFLTYNGKHVLTDGQRRIEIHSIAGNSHNDAFDLVYLPAEKILVEADAFTLPATGAPVPSPANPYSVNLYENIQKLNLDVQRIAGLHGARVATLADLKGYIGLADPGEAKGKKGTKAAAKAVKAKAAG